MCRGCSGSPEASKTTEEVAGDDGDSVAAAAVNDGNVHALYAARNFVLHCRASAAAAASLSSSLVSAAVAASASVADR